ncbi:uncharacterized protein LOC131948644 [Physella acuta]|uniref:uncharacterized protein LOC131948644 n=1 Tax=Physella acuta TaxID=109671 RepID=UPI0027DE8A2B|nr:uncharacterized protein LOC131948644 [Physella acuta]XP_059166244.1 uncharacterized protein LOC131948644 [Physella acuta]
MSNLSPGEDAGQVAVATDTVEDIANIETTFLDHTEEEPLLLQETVTSDKKHLHELGDVRELGDATRMKQTNGVASDAEGGVSFGVGSTPKEVGQFQKSEKAKNRSGAGENEVLIDGLVSSDYDPVSEPLLADNERASPPRGSVSQVQSPQQQGRTDVKQQGVFKKTPMPRSQSQPLTTDEAVYSQYWRGQVTVIKSPEAVQAEACVKPDKAPPLTDAMSRSGIARSILMGNNILVLECLRQGESPHTICSKSGMSFLHIVATNATPEHEVKYVPMVFQLSNAGINLNVKDKDGNTAVRIAILRRLPQILAALLKCGAEVEEMDLELAEQVRGVAKSDILEILRRLTPSYWSAVHDVTPYKVHRLVKSWSRVNLSRNGQTLVEYAKQNAKEESVSKMLIEHEASIELAHAVMAGDSERTQFLLCNGAADLNTRDTSVKNNCFEPFSPLTLVGAAIKYGHVSVLSVLRDADKRIASGLAKPASDFEAGGDRRAMRPDRVRKTQSYDLASNTVFHYRSDNGGSCEMRENDAVTSSLCNIL